MQKFLETFLICKKLNEEDGDWEKKNKLNVFEGIISFLKKDFKQAANLFIGCLNTFNATEIMSFETLVLYCSILGLITLNRRDFKEKIINNPEVLSVFLENKLLSEFVNSIYCSRYREIFKLLLEANTQLISNDRFLKVHRMQIITKIRIVIFSQYL